MFAAINIGIDFFAILTNFKCSSLSPVVPEIKGSLFLRQKLTETINPSGEEKSMTADIFFKSMLFA